MPERTLPPGLTLMVVNKRNGAILHGDVMEHSADWIKVRIYGMPRPYVFVLFGESVYVEAENTIYTHW